MGQNNYQLVLKGVTKIFPNGVIAVKNLDLEINRGEFLTILGPSGCGKTTTLRMIAGFEIPTEGEIYCEDIHLNPVPANKRPVNTVFQDYGLFPHMTVYENISYGLKAKKVPKDQIDKEVIDALEMVSLSGFEKRYPRQLSGGQQQRVAVARAIVNKPRVLLLDEPLGALDLKLRKHMQIVLKELQQELGITFIHVTHDQEEAMTMSDRIAVLNDGMLEQIDTPEELYLHPTTSFVAGFIGENNLIEVRVMEIASDTVTLELEGSTVFVDRKNMQGGIEKGSMATLSIRPEAIQVESLDSQIKNVLEGKIEQDIFAGSEVRLIIGCGSQKLMSNLNDRKYFHTYSRGQNIKLGWKKDDAMLFMPSKEEEA